MERPRYREAARGGPGGSGPGGGSSAAGNGSCGHPPAATGTGTDTGTGTGTGTGTAGGGDESGERDPPVTGPGGDRVSPPPGNVPTPRSVPTPGNVPNPSGVPSPGGRCGCSPPSPSRDLPCGLGCRHRGPRDGTGDTRGARRPPRQRHDDPGRGQRLSLGVARAGVALFLLLLLLGGLRSFLRRSRDLLRPWLRRREEEEEEVTRLVAVVAEEEPEPFRGLGVQPAASDTELRRACRRLALLVHPDKSRDPRAEAAFPVLRERLSSPERRREFQAKQLVWLELVLGAFLARLQEELRDAMGCTRCGGATGPPPRAALPPPAPPRISWPTFSRDPPKARGVPPRGTRSTRGGRRGGGRSRAEEKPPQTLTPKNQEPQKKTPKNLKTPQKKGLEFFKKSIFFF
uniref:dnaJ homolog subfamily C member 14 n=1 Tax=Lonchura striata TaxID=40157 RepID=UPI0012931385|nr:dnaJ homolog subfamily C member 14 [Lonchura striata domestica]